MSDYELYHYGVKGMKWGIIRWKDKLGYGRLHKKATKYDAKIEKKQNKKHVNQKKLQKLIDKKKKIQDAMDRKYSDLTPEEKAKGAKAYSKIMKVAKGLGILGAGIGIGALATSIADNGGIRKEFKADSSDMINVGWSGHSGAKIGDTVRVSAKGKNALAIGKWVFEFGDSFYKTGSAIVNKVGEFGQAVGFENFK